MTKYTLISKKYPDVKAEVTYRDEGSLYGVVFISDMDGVQKSWLLTHVPKLESELQYLQKYFTVEQIIGDLSFDAFWDKYNYKVGNKKRAEKLWNALSEADRIQALKVIASYDNWLKRKNYIQEKCYPETYLNQRRFESKFL